MKNKLTWVRISPLHPTDRYSFTTVGVRGDRYWVRPIGMDSFYVADDCGGTWGDYPSSREAMAAVESHVN